MTLTIDHVSKHFGKKLAVKDFTAELSAGIYGILGPNGSGKSTLMRILAQVMKPTSGQVLYNGVDIQQLDGEYRDILGYLPQDFGVYKEFTAHKFLMYISALKGLDTKQAQQRVEELLSLVNLSEAKTVKLGKLSGGMRQRVGIAQALLNHPKVLIVDEPTAGLDPQERIRVRNLLSDISKDRIVLLSTHIVSDIEFIAKELILMKEGMLVTQDSPERMLKDLKGKVWTACVNESLANKLMRQFKVTNLLRKTTGVEIRLLSEEKPFELSSPETPRLEDLYLHHFGEPTLKEAQ